MPGSALNAFIDFRISCLPGSSETAFFLERLKEENFSKDTQLVNGSSRIHAQMQLVHAMNRNKI